MSAASTFSLKKLFLATSSAFSARTCLISAWREASVSSRRVILLLESFRLFSAFLASSIFTERLRKSSS
uniref:Uncharacterized protein n=1 Tax=Ixodes ricinus TaxID=34613 RepID=A0A6B0U0V6_IXORI